MYSNHHHLFQPHPETSQREVFQKMGDFKSKCQQGPCYKQNSFKANIQG